MEETDIRNYEGRRLPERPDVVVIDASFISLKTVLPAALALAAAPISAGTDQAAIRGAPVDIKNGIVKDADVHQHGCDDIAAFADSLGCKDIAIFQSLDRWRRRQPRILSRSAAWLRSSDHRSCRPSRRRRRDRDGASIYVPFTLGGETVEVEPVAGHPDRRALAAHRHASAERIDAVLQAFRRLRRLRDPALARRSLPGWKRELVVEALSQAGIDCEVAPLIDAHGAGRRRITLHARKGTHEVLKSASPPPAHTTSCRSTAARSSILRSTARSMPPGRWPSR